jgi:hypothetical protein
MNYPKLNPNNFVPRWVIDSAKRRKEKEFVAYQLPQKKEKKEITK